MLYSDLSNSVSKVRVTNRTPSKQLGRVTDVSSVYQSIDNILKTRKGERVFQPKFGSDISALLFEPMDDITANSILSRLFEAIEVWEHRVIVDYGRSYIVPDVDNHTYNVFLTFRIKGLSPDQYEYQGAIGASSLR